MSVTYSMNFDTAIRCKSEAKRLRRLLAKMLESRLEQEKMDEGKAIAKGI